MQKGFINHLSVLLKKEFILINRSRESLISVFFFSFLIILIFHFGFSLEGLNLVPFVLPFIWLAVLFGGMLRMNHTFEPENEGKVLDGLRLVKGIAVPFFLSKFLLNFIYVLFLELVAFFLVIIFFNLHAPFTYLSSVWLPFILGGFGFSCVGTTFASMVINHSRRNLILPVIVYPIIAPLIIGVLKSIVYGVDGRLLGLDASWLQILITFDVIYLVLSIMVFDVLLEG